MSGKEEERDSARGDDSVEDMIGLIIANTPYKSTNFASMFHLLH
jgi:hypothetical protein